MIVSIGDASIDHYISSDKKYVGGIATNFAVHVHRYQLPVTLISAVGSDDNGDFVVDALSKEGISVDYIEKLEGSTAVQNIQVINDERQFVGYHVGVLDAFRLEKKHFDLLNKSQMIVAPLSDGLKTVFDQIADFQLLGVTKIADFSRDADIEGFEHGDVLRMLRHYIEKFDIAFLGGDVTIIDKVREIAESFPGKIIILTCGVDGSIAFFEGNEYKQPAIHIEKVVDTTGCGDAFRAGFVASYFQHKDIPEALKEGTKKGAEVAAHIAGF